MSSLDSAFDSQRFYSQQNDKNSQLSTQDLFTPISGSQNEQRNNEKMSMYEKWLSKRSLFKQEALGEDKRACWQPVGNQPKNSSKKSTSQLFSNSQKETDSWASMQRSHKSKAYERDERDYLEQIALTVQENTHEMKSFTHETRDALIKLGDLMREETRQTMSAFMDNVKKFQEDFQSSLQAKEQTVIKMDELKKINSKKDSEIAGLQAKLQMAEITRTEDLAQFTRTVAEILNPSQELVIKKFEDLSERTSQVYQNLITFKEMSETQTQECQNLAKTSSSNIKDMEKRLMKELKKCENDLTTSKAVREAVEICLENWLGDVQQLLQNKLDSYSRNSKTELKDTLAQNHKKTIEECLRKHLSVVFDRLEEISQKSCRETNLQESNFKAIADCGYDKIKASVEECKTTFERETRQLKQIDQRLKHCTENLLAVQNHLLTSHPIRREGESTSSTSQSNTNALIPKVLSGRSVTEYGHNPSHRNLNGDYGQQMQNREGIREKGFFNAFAQNLPTSSTLDISYQVHQNKSFSSQNKYPQHTSAGNKNLQSLLQKPTRMTMANKFVETEKLVPTSQRDVSPFQHYNSIKINPSPVATVKPQRIINSSPQRRINSSPQRRINQTPQRRIHSSSQRRINPSPQRINPSPQRRINSSPQRRINPTPQRRNNPSSQRRINPTPQRRNNPSSQRRINPLQHIPLWREDAPNTSHNVPTESKKYDLRKRKLNEEQYFPKYGKVKSYSGNAKRKGFGEKLHENTLGSLREKLQQNDSNGIYSNDKIFLNIQRIHENGVKDQQKSLDRKIPVPIEKRDSADYLMRYEGIKDDEDSDQENNSLCGDLHASSSPSFSTPFNRISILTSRSKGWTYGEPRIRATIDQALQNSPQPTLLSEII